MKEVENLIDAGISDKRLLVNESEFANVLATMKRDSNTLSGIIRLAWEGGRLSTLTKNSPVKATGAHVGIVGNITKEELLSSLTTVDSQNGFMNRFLVVMSKRSKLLPLGGLPVDLSQLKERLAAAIRFARQKERRFEFDDDAREHWTSLYIGPLTKPKPGLVGKVTSRGAPYILRLATIYAVLDLSEVVQLCHLKAAYAVWNYCEASARYIFGESTGNPAEDKILNKLKEGPQTSSSLHKIFNNHQRGFELNATLHSLVQKGLIRRERNSRTGGRPADVWQLT